MNCTKSPSYLPGGPAPGAPAASEASGRGRRALDDCATPLFGPNRQVLSVLGQVAEPTVLTTEGTH